MPDRTSLAEQQLIEGHLKGLKSLDGLRRLLADLDYRVSDEPVSVAEWKSELAKVAKDGSLRTIARHDDFVVTHSFLQELRVGAEREIVTKLVRQYDRGLFIFSDYEESHWHLVNVKRDSRQHNRLVLRRIAVGPEEQLRTAIERISLLKVKEASWPGLEVELEHEEAFDVEKVTDQFYWDYKDIFDHIVDRLKHQVNLRTARAFAQQFMNRMMFLYFLQKKGWLDGRRDFVPWLWQKYQENPAAQGNFYTGYLDPLFFLGFTSSSDDLTPSVAKQQLYARQDIPEEIKQVFLRLPFLNGGLFSKIDGVDGQGLEILDSEFDSLFENLLEHYNFTVSEATPLDVEVAVNPEMLGKVYENLVLEEERGQAGIFYTPRVELDFMCRRALIEYLDEEPIVDRPDLIRLVMNADTPEFVPDFPPERLREIRRKLDEVAVVDPACGSGAFLVGMMQVLSGLHRLICDRLREPYHDFLVKKRIIGENLFGVDIKDWAVRVAELRLWLSLIINASLDEVQGEPGKAILPNLTFRIQAGDSLVEEIAGRSLSLRGRYTQMSPEVRRQVNRLVDCKMDYYYNRGEVMRDQEIRRLETEIFRAILDDELDQIDRELRRLRAQEQEGFQQELDIVRAGGPARAGGAQVSPEKARLRREIERLEHERGQIIAVRDSQDIERGKGPFLWDIEFAEVFQGKGGFDIVIGNPPYVRQEDIAPLDKDPQNFSADQWLEEKRRYKAALQRSVQTYWGPEVRIGGRADYYVYFYLHGLALLRERGTFCFITSNSWLDVGYGADLQRFLLTNIEIKDIYDNHAKRSFVSSDINTVIVLFQRPPAGSDLSAHRARFVAFKRPFEEVLTVENLTLIEWADSIQRTDELRVYPLSQEELWQAGIGSEDDTKKTMALGFGHGRYSGSKWGGRYLQATDIFLAVIEKAADRLQAFEPAIAQVITVSWSRQGQNQYLMFPQAEASRGSVEPLVGVLKSPRDINTIAFKKEDTRYLLRLTTEVRHQIRHAPLLWVDLRGDKHICHYNVDDVPFTHNFHGIVPKDPASTEVLCAFLNSTFVWFFIETIGRKGLGGGAIRLLVEDLSSERMCLVPSALTEKQQDRLVSLMRTQLAIRPVRSVFEELGLPRANADYSNIDPQLVDLNHVVADRLALDKVIAEALGLTSEEHLEVYRAVVQLTKDRLARARSV